MIRDDERQEIVEAVEAINKDIRKAYQSAANGRIWTIYLYWSYLKIEESMGYCRVQFMGVTMYDTNNEYIFELEENALVEEYLRKEVNKLVTSISSIKL